MKKIAVILFTSLALLACGLDEDNDGSDGSSSSQSSLTIHYNTK